MKTLRCSGPGPHRPVDGALGEVPDNDTTTSARCSSPSCEPAPDTTSSTTYTALRDRVRQGLDANRTYLSLASPGAAQNTAQVKALTRQNVALTRLVLGLLDGTE